MYESQSRKSSVNLGPNGSSPSMKSTGETRTGPSLEYVRYLKHRRRHTFLVRLSQLILLVVILGLWQVSVHAGWVDSMLTSSPSQIVSTFGQLWHQGKIVSDTWITTKETIVGFVISMVVGVVLAIILWWSSFTSEVVDPYLVVLNALPKVALGPIFFIWLGDRLSIYGMAIAISLIVTIMMLASGYKEIDAGRLKLMASFGATKWQILRIVVLPVSIPNLVATMKVNLGLTFVGVIMGEFLSAKAGLGFLIIYGGQVFQMGLVMTSIAILVVLSLIMYGIVSFFGKLLLKHYNFD